MCNHYRDNIPERTLDEPDPHAHDEPPGEYEHEDEPDPLESGVDLVETLWLIGTGKTLKGWTTK